MNSFRHSQHGEIFVCYLIVLSTNKDDGGGWATHTFEDLIEGYWTPHSYWREAHTRKKWEDNTVSILPLPLTYFIFPKPL